MFFYDVLYLSACNAWRDRARTILTALSICIGVASVILISTLGDSGCAVVTKEVEKLGISGITLYSQKESVELKNSDIKTLSKSFGATSSVQPLIIEIGKYKIKGGEYDALLWGVGDCVDKIIGFELIFGRNFTKSDIAQSKKVAIVDRELAIEKYKRENIVGK